MEISNSPGHSFLNILDIVIVAAQVPGPSLGEVRTVIKNLLVYFAFFPTIVMGSFMHWINSTGKNVIKR
jgi:hypothetical protein